MQDIPATAVVNALQMPALLIGPDERVLASNGACKRLLGSDLVGRHFITILRQPSLLDAVELCAQTGEGQSAQYLTTEGERDTTWQAALSAVPLPSGGPAVLITFTDLTDMLEATQIRRQFVSNVSHELRTPLTSILGFVETLRGPARSDPKAQERFLGVINTEATRMAQLVDDLLSLSRVEEEERRRPVDPVDLGMMVRAALAGLEPLASKNAVILAFNNQAEGATAPGDARQLGQVMTNLVENAIKYGGQGGKVEITLEPPSYTAALRADAYSLAVIDTGDGIPEHHIPRLTERFYRLDSHRSRDLGGTGLGLAIVKHIINRHRGRLRISSTPGVGSQFTVLLPVK